MNRREICQQFGLNFWWIVPHWVCVRDVEIDGQPSYVDMWQTSHQWKTVGNYYAIHSQPLNQENSTQTIRKHFVLGMTMEVVR